MSRHAILAVALAFATTGQAAIHWLSEYEKALEFAKKTGRPMVLVFAMAENEKAIKAVFDRDPLPALHRYYLFVYLVVDIKDRSFFHPLFYKYQPAQGSQMPLVILADANEHKIGSTSGTLDPKAIATEMAEALKKHGPPANARKAQQIAQELERAKALLEKKEIGPAARILQAIVDQNFKLPATEAAKKQLAPIAEAASRDLAAGKAALEQKNYAEAVARFSGLEQTFPTLEAGKEAGKELAALREVPEAKAAFEKQAKKGEMAHARGTVAAKPTTDPNDIDNDFFTDDELDALDRMAAGTAQPEKPAADPGAECRRQLSLARSWIANKRPDKAKEILGRIIAESPDSLYADQAKALLKKLGE